MSDKLKRVEKLIRFLIFNEKLNYSSVQKGLTEKLKSEKSVISRALKGDEKYLTDNFIDKLNAVFDNEFDLEWLLTGKGEMLKNNQQIGDIAQSTVVGANVNGNGINITNNNFSEMIELQKGYQELLKKRDEHISELLLIVNKLTDNGK
jgi:hypothetical protein